MFLRTRDEPNRLRRAGRTARDAGKTAREAVQSTTETARDAVQSTAEGKPLALRLLVVPIVVGAIVFVVRAMRTRRAAGETATDETAGTDESSENRQAGQTGRHDNRAHAVSH
jgi:uncharacterized protein HemX